MVAKRKAGRGLLPARAIVVARLKAGRGLLPARAIVGVRLKGVAKESTGCQPVVPMVAKQRVIVH
jgi:hypothetical protein